MDDLMKENLEDHLAGMLAGERKSEFEAYLAKHPKAAEELARFEESAELLRMLRSEDGDEMSLRPAPGFYGRVMRQVNDERGVPFWMVFLEPLLLRRLAFASLMWLALLGSYIAVSGSPDPRNPHFAEHILTRPPTPEYEVRLGPDLDENRASMLSVMLAAK
jgi:anti-sigma factor RsiW